METDKHYLRVGSFVLIILLAIAGFTVWVTGIYNTEQYRFYRVRFSESVSGLDVGSLVKFHGVQVGKVEAMSIDPADMRLIRVDVSIIKTAPIKSNTVATLKLQGITGAVYIELSGTTPGAPDVTGSDDIADDNLPEIKAETSTLATIMDRVPEILDKVSHIADQADKLLSDKNIATLSKTFGNVQKASHNADELSEELKANPTKLLFAPKEKPKQN